MPRVLAATLTWNHQGRAARCLDSLLKLDYPDFEVAVVDNHSTDGTYEFLCSQYPQVHVIRHRENFGYGEGVNGQLRHAMERGVDYLLSVDNDGVADPAALSEMMRAAEGDPKTGIVFPKVYEGSGTERIWAAGGCRVEDVDWWKGWIPGLVPDGAEGGADDREREAHLFRGGFWLVKMEAVRKTGYFDPDYFIYYDDLDWFYRLHRAGYIGRYVPSARMWHEPASTFGRDSEAYHYYKTRNRLLFFRRYAPKAIFPFFLAFSFFNFLKELVHSRRIGVSRAERGGRWMGWIDFLAGKLRNREFPSPAVSGWKQTGDRLRHKTVSLVRSARLLAKRMIGLPLRIQVAVDWNIGDEILAIPVYEGLKKKFPGVRMDAEVRFPELLEGNPFVDEVNGGEGFDPDLEINLHRDIRHEPRSVTLPRLAGVTAPCAPQIYLRQDEIEEAKRRWPAGGSRLRMAVSPSVWWLARRWPRENWVRVVQYFLDSYPMEVYILGRDDKPFPLGIDLIGKTDLREAAALLSQCQLFMASDSGLLHLALAVGTPSVGLFGLSDPGMLYYRVPHFLPVWSDIECRGCWHDYRMKGRDLCPKVDPDCMTSIPVSRVIEAGQSLLARQNLKVTSDVP